MSVLSKLCRQKGEHNNNKMQWNDLKMLPKISDLMTMFWPFITQHNSDLSKQRHIMYDYAYSVVYERFHILDAFWLLFLCSTL